MRIVFHGEAASAFADGFASLLNAPAEIAVLPDQLEGEADRLSQMASDLSHLIGKFKLSRQEVETL